MAEEKTETLKSDDAQAAMQEEPLQEIPQLEITAEQRQMKGVKTAKVSKNPFKKIIRTVGRIEVDERRQATINAKIEGWIEKLHVDYTGAYVKEGEPLAEIYSPELLATQLEFINALKWVERETDVAHLSDAGHEGHDNNTTPAIEPITELQRMLSKDAAETVDAARQRLRLWDMSDVQIAEVEETRKPFRTVTLYSTVSGYVTEKTAVIGMKVMPGEKLFDVADLSDLWIIADIYEYELPFIKAGQKARITLSYVPDKDFFSMIDYIYPTISGDTRTAKIRLALPNSDGQIKAQMYTNVEISIDLGKRLTIPESAVIDTGEQQVVYVDLGNGFFEPRAVQTGLRSDGNVEVLKGLEEGETVSTAANFLIDSEAQLKGVKPLTGQ
ncbi:MAG TPA: efflux RND transporter periplasmic adaptor subunit [Desulfatiglandales bacterium]|nr:efflux RND transporter periplasmic adaptor subunit [Desulfatiglandales bacterium]